MIYTLLDIIIKETSFVKRRVTDCKHDGMKECDRIFNIYLEELYKTPSDVEKTRKLYNHYQEKRNELNHKWSTIYKLIVDNKNSKDLWRATDWSGEIKKSAPLHNPHIEELSEHFTTLYELIKNDGDISQLNSNIHS